MEINVLDHGYVKHIESWGTGVGGQPGNWKMEDSEVGIIEAARQSTQGSFRGWEKDANLLKYLYEHKHETPFEFAGMVIEVQAPIFVFREWHRHRTQCLAPDTAITLVSPRGTTYKRTIQQLFQLKHGGVIDSAPSRHHNGYSKAGTPVTRKARRKQPWRVRILPNCQSRVLRTLDEESGQYRTGLMKDVWEAGKKEVWEVSTGKGRVRASAEHPFYTKNGWVNLRDLQPGELLATSGRVASQERPIPPSLRQGINNWTALMRKRLILPKDKCYICNRQFQYADLGLDHVIPVFVDLGRALDTSNLKPICGECHRRKTDGEQPSKKGRIVLGLVWTSVERRPCRVAESMTYDLEMVGPDNNYVANGLVVHNSFNEMSARYAPLPNLNYVPTDERVAMVPASDSAQNKTSGAKVADEVDRKYWERRIRSLYAEIDVVYQQALAHGIPKELARIVLPVGRYSRMRACANLRNWLAFLTLRMSPDAQQEIRMYANAVGKIIEQEFPRTWELFKTSLGDAQ